MKLQILFVSMLIGWTTTLPLEAQRRRLGGISGSAHRMKPSLIGENLSSNRWNQLSPDTLQVVVFYDGAETGSARLGIQVRARGGSRHWIWIKRLRKFDRAIETREYALKGAVPTGKFRVRGVVPDGVIDGIAFGLFWKDSEGEYHMLKSNDPSPSEGARFVCGWPLGMNDALFRERTPQITNPFGRATAKTAICGARLLPEGYYRIR